METVLYLHGRGGSAAEAERYRALFPDCRVAGLDYRADTPWEAGREICEAVRELRRNGEPLTLIANSVGAFFSLCAGIDSLVRRAYFISPIVDMERLIRDMMDREGVTEEELERRGVIPTAWGEDLSWEYLQWVRSHPVRWDVPTEILWGERDVLTSRETISTFAARHGAALTVMEGGEHWFHTAGQLAFLDGWIRAAEEREDTPR